MIPKPITLEAWMHEGTAHELRISPRSGQLYIVYYAGGYWDLCNNDFHTPDFCIDTRH